MIQTIKKYKFLILIVVVILLVISPKIAENFQSVPEDTNVVLLPDDIVPDEEYTEPTWNYMTSFNISDILIPNDWAHDEITWSSWENETIRVEIERQWSCQNVCDDGVE